jgi:ribose 5-phosphate isomerase B
MKIAIGSDNACHLSDEIIKHIEAKGITVERYGALVRAKADYVDGAREVAEAVASGSCNEGLLFCTTGTGASIVANKVPGIRAALCMDSFSAKIARLANNANVLVLGIRLTGEILAKEIVDTWLETDSSTAAPWRVEFHRKVDEIDKQYRKRP